ncbi:sigma-70 family RNA polymerase sigma factor [bacterium RCC_150]
MENPPSLSVFKTESEPVEVRDVDLGGGQLHRAFESPLVLQHLDLAEMLAARFANGGRERADLKQVAYLGLVKAARTFDPGRGCAFVAYAIPTIRGELKRYLRDHCWMIRPPRHVQDTHIVLNRVENELSQRFGRAPTDAEAAEEMAVSVTEVREARVASMSMHPETLDGTDPHFPQARTAMTAHDGGIEQLEDMLCLRQALETLDPSDRDLLYRRFYLEETQVELGRSLGVSQMQVSRRLAKILVQLQRVLVEGSLKEPTVTAPQIPQARTPRPPAATRLTRVTRGQGPVRKGPRAQGRLSPARGAFLEAVPVFLRTPEGTTLRIGGPSRMPRGLRPYLP